MSSNKTGYLLGLGSNIDPHNNFAQIAALLLKRFDHLSLSRVLHIPPVGMNSQHQFLNAVAFIETDIDETSLKQICNQIEISLGRDRDDPNSKYKDRPADLDILTYAQFPKDFEREANNITDEYFLYSLIEEIKAYLCHKPIPRSMQKGTTITVNNLTFGESATTIYRNRHAG